MTTFYTILTILAAVAIVASVAWLWCSTPYNRRDRPEDREKDEG